MGSPHHALPHHYVHDHYYQPHHKQYYEHQSSHHHEHNQHSGRPEYDGCPVYRDFGLPQHHLGGVDLDGQVLVVHHVGA